MAIVKGPSNQRIGFRALPMRLRRVARSIYGLVARGNFVPALLGLLLIAAALLKALHLATNPVLETGLFESRWFQIGWVEFELLFGGWLITGWHPRPTRVAAMILFAALAGLSFAKAVAGESDCGCFGEITVNPWMMFLLDVAAVGALCVFGTSGASPVAVFRGSLIRRGRSNASLRIAINALLLCTVMSIGCVVGWTAARPKEAVTGKSHTVDPRQTVVLDPQTWIGHPFPLLNEIDTGNELRSGQWLILLYQAGCSTCDTARQKLETTVPNDQRQCMIISVPPHATDDNSTGVGVAQALVRRGRLNETSNWSIHVPVSMTLSDGYVVSIVHRDPSTKDTSVGF